jgi:hypothetical protein
VKTETKDEVDVLIQEDCRITTSKMCTAVWFGKLAFMAIIRKLGSRKECISWVLKIVTVEHKTARKYVCADFLQCLEKVINTFL